ncbi:hypothetical protein GCM10010978_32860 [Compostibacillus humi]|uniref:Uncharacterized protein n=1 Tax=Compostibacillus humi TaxID=1245525 RepID=A0A8J2TSY5_9BACI|nr:hypothetical protein [Compostibacillus humi]GFZ91927.1 hypothetical protein GCM10010978_32860 [Compostibacillus humi]
MLIYNIQGEMSSVKTDISTIQGEMSSVKTDISTIQEELSSVKIDVSNIKEELSEFKQEQRRLSKDIISSFGQYHDKLERYVDDRSEALNKRVYRLESEMEKILRK